MKSAGCESIHIGVESGSPKVFKSLNKGISFDQTIEACKLIKNSGIKLKAFFMVGLPGETEEDIKQSMSLVQELEPYEAILQIYVPYPRTKLFQQIAQENDMAEFYDWYCFYKARVNYRMLSLPPSKFDALLEEFFQLVENINRRSNVY
jgi:radical SAM superfamily enzyme YgiQ (UPF0313 family)